MAQKTLTRKKSGPRLGDLQTRTAAILRVLKREYPEAQCSLDYDSPYQLLMATILSAQCTDERVNQVTPALFIRFPTVTDMAGAKLSVIEKLIQSTGFFRAKAKSLKTSSQAIVQNHAGQVPRTLEDLVLLHGVGRKTANVILGHAYGIPGLPVDTHVGRVSRRLGLTLHKDPVKVETDLTELVPSSDWTLFSLLLIYQGRAICKARSPNCSECPLAELCPKLLNL